jgi:glycine/D-amino acid oxidase-like deaminating enzyme
MRGMTERAALPERISIVIVGGGLGGWSVAVALGPAARDAVLLDDGDANDAHDASLGLARTLPALPLARLAAGHGEASAARWIAAQARNHVLLSGAGVPVRRGTARFAAAGEPADELRRSVQILAALGGRGEIVPPADLLPAVPHRFEVASLHAEDFVLDPAALVAALRGRALAHGLRLHRATRVESLHDTDGVRIETTEGTLQAEIAIVATGAEIPRLVPFARFKIVGLRAQWLAAELEADPVTGARAISGWSDAEGHERWAERSPGEVRLCGSRDLPVRRELGARSGTSDDVQELLERNLREFPHLASSRVVSRGAAVQAVPCDGLPLVGAVPGHPRLLIAGGFGCDAPGVALVAGETVAQLALTGRAEHALAFSPRRFL